MSEHQWHLLDAMPDAVIVVRSDASIARVNANAERLFGYSRDEFSHLALDQLIPDRFRRGHAEQVAAFFANPAYRPMGTGFEVKALRKDGSEFDVDISLGTAPKPAGTLAVASVRDISERADFIEALQKSSTFNLSVLESLQDHVAILDKNGRIVATNTAWNQFGCEHGIAPGGGAVVGVDYLQVCRRWAASGDENACEALEGIQSVLRKSRNSVTLEYACQSSDRQRWFLMRVMPMHGPHEGVIVAHTDITERKKAEMRLQSALREIETLSDRLEAENVFLQQQLSDLQGFEEIVGRSEPLNFALDQVERVAGTAANVLLLGETGTGKELFARAIHLRSPRKGRSLVTVNCAALPAELIESELLGHMAGAFTGALADRVGRFELADGGTLFLDEIGELDVELQSKLLRILQDGEFERIGGTETLHVDVRVIAATNRNLEQSMIDGSFRRDLYYRLAVFPIRLPPLRERPEDIPLLVAHFVEKKQKRMGKTITDIRNDVLEALMAYDWPGNVRELENVIERAIILSPGPTLVMNEAFSRLRTAPPSAVASNRMDDVEQAHILGVLKDCDWRIKGPEGAAKRLGMNPSTLRYRLKKLGIRRPGATG